ncbi:hypothetical protein ACJMK2_039218 [Sinanodonta woodiana]|uniref:Uncharacterized protein n=1 Tax=Sinanodonta woodiana TaxID=1069815 RepID=A0ABD3WBB5_SINWO
MADTYTIYNPWKFVHTQDFEEIQIVEIEEEEITSEDGAQSYSMVEDIDHSDVQEEKFLLRFADTDVARENRYLRVTPTGEVKTDGSRADSGSLFEVIHWFCSTRNSYQLICQMNQLILYMDGTSLQTRPYDPDKDKNDPTTMFQMQAKGHNLRLRGFVSNSDIPLFFDEQGNYRPEGPKLKSADNMNARLNPVYFVTFCVKTIKITSV